MAEPGTGKVVDRGTRCLKAFIYLPKEVVSDTAFPFGMGEDVTVVIEGETLIIKKFKASYFVSGLEFPEANEIRI